MISLILILVLVIVLCVCISMIKKYRNNPRITFNMVCFYSEGLPNDNALPLSHNKDLILQSAGKHFDNIQFYTPTLLKSLGLNKYVKEYKHTGLVTANPGMSKVGFSAWKPKILLMELEKMKTGDILIYRDCNIKKYPVLSIYSNIKEIAKNCLDICKFDFFSARERDTMKIREYTKTNVIRELGEDHPFTYEFPNMIANLIIIRKSNTSIQLLNEWHDGCMNDKWINGIQYGSLDRQFRHSCSEQSILGVIIANWVRNGKHGIPKRYPMIGFRNRDISQMFYYTNYDYLNHL